VYRGCDDAGRVGETARADRMRVISLQIHAGMSPVTVSALAEDSRGVIWGHDARDSTGHDTLTGCLSRRLSTLHDANSWSPVFPRCSRPERSPPSTTAAGCGKHPQREQNIRARQYANLRPLAPGWETVGVPGQVTGGNAVHIGLAARPPVLGFMGDPSGRVPVVFPRVPPADTGGEVASAACRRSAANASPPRRAARPTRGRRYSNNYATHGTSRGDDAPVFEAHRTAGRVLRLRGPWSDSPAKLHGASGIGLAPIWEPDRKPRHDQAPVWVLQPILPAPSRAAHSRRPGRRGSERSADHAQRLRAEAGLGSPASEIAQSQKLLDDGVVSPEEFEKPTQKALA
jgi:hypothetical protein